MRPTPVLNTAREGCTTFNPDRLLQLTLHPKVSTNAPNGKIICRSLGEEDLWPCGGTTSVPPLVFHHSSLESPAKVTGTVSKSWRLALKGITACVAPLSSKATAAIRGEIGVGCTILTPKSLVIDLRVSSWALSEARVTGVPWVIPDGDPPVASCACGPAFACGAAWGTSAEDAEFAGFACWSINAASASIDLICWASLTDGGGGGGMSLSPPAFGNTPAFP